MDSPSIFILFALAITLHNIEEALWLPQWSKYAKKFHKPVTKDEFHFAVLLYTIAAYLITALFLFFPQSEIIKYAYFGYAGAMILNAVMPHLAASIVLKRYAPGTVTGVFLNIPVNSLIITYSISKGLIDLTVVVISTLITGILLIALLKPSFLLGRKLIRY
ncbi:MAG: HXXEE domain-containing protein [Clostridia bacterium]|nr:HXXEE domain-containing protein [Clostridia bacterium]